MNPTYKYNPFSGVLETDIEEILVPRFNIEDLISKINTSVSLAIEFLGKQGRGKTTHLVNLQKRMEEYPIFLLDASSSLSDITDTQSKLIFIDSIHHLSIVDRVKLLKRKQIVVFTTHWSRKFECLLARKELYTIKFKGISVDLLLEVIEKRLQLASANETDDAERFSRDKVESLIMKFGDNYRGIINHLYEQYQ